MFAATWDIGMQNSRGMSESPSQCAENQGLGFNMDHVCDYQLQDPAWANCSEPCAYTETLESCASVHSTSSDSATPEPVSKEKKIKEGLWQVEIGRFQHGQPAFISVVDIHDTNDSSHSTTAESQGGRVTQAGGEKKSRPCKGKRQRYKKLVERLKTEISSNAESFNIEDVRFPPSLLKNTEQREKLIHYMGCYQNKVKARAHSEQW